MSGNRSLDGADKAELVQDMFDGAIRKAFPEASEVDYYGASITIHPGNKMILRCAGKEIEWPLP